MRKTMISEAPIKLSSYNTNQLRDLAGVLGADTKKLYGTSKDSIIRVIDDIKAKSKPVTYSVMKEVEVGDFSKDRMEIDSFRGTLDDVIKKYLTGEYGKIKSVDQNKKEIIVENTQRNINTQHAILEGLNKNKQMPLRDLILLRAAYNEDLHNAIEKGNQKELDKWLSNYRKDKSNAMELSWYTDEKVNVKELKKALADQDKDYEDAHKSGRKIFGA